jgi:hypothetical protein
MAVRQGAPDLQGLARIGEGHASLQKRAQALHHGHRQLGEVGQSAFLDLAALAPALAQQHGRRRAAIGTISMNIATEVQSRFTVSSLVYMDTKLLQKSPSFHGIKVLGLFDVKTSV